MVRSGPVEVFDWLLHLIRSLSETSNDSLLTQRLPNPSILHQRFKFFLLVRSLRYVSCTIVFQCLLLQGTHLPLTVSLQSSMFLPLLPSSHVPRNQSLLLNNRWEAESIFWTDCTGWENGDSRDWRWGIGWSVLSQILVLLCYFSSQRTSRILCSVL